MWYNAEITQRLTRWFIKSSKKHRPISSDDCKTAERRKKSSRITYCQKEHLVGETSSELHDAYRVPIFADK